MNLMEKYGEAAGKESIRQFCPPRCFELSGRELHFVIDTGEECGEYLLHFLDKRQLEWSKGGDAPKAATYECRKSDDETYLLTYNYEGKEPRENHTWIIDMENELVTFLRCALGENPKWPLLVESHFGFGYIQIGDKEHTDIRRHGFTNDVTGTSVRWTYGNTLSTIHVYHDPHWYRIGYPRGEDPSADSASQIRMLLAEMPSSDEPCYYVKIKDGMYFLSLTEQNLEKHLGARFGFRSDTLCFLDNWKQLISVGRAFGTWTKEGKDEPLLMMIGKYGSPQEVDDHFFTDPIPYLM